MQGFTNEQEQVYSKYKKIQKYFGDNITKVNTFIPLDDENTDFNTNITAVEGVVPRKTVDNSGITDEKETDKRDVADFWSPICKKVRAYALKVKNKELAEDFNHRTHTSFLKLLDGDVEPTCKHLKDVITPLLADPLFTPYGIVAGDLTAGMTLATEFKSMIGKTDEADADITVASGTIDKIMDDLLANNTQFTLLIDHFITTDPEFVAGYNAVNVIEDIGVHHNGMEGFVKNKKDGTVISGATVKNPQTGKTAVSDLTGFYSLIKMVPGNYEFEVSAPGKTTLRIVIRIRRGQIIHVDFELD